MPKYHQQKLTYKKKHKGSYYRGVYKTNKGWIAKISMNGVIQIMGPFDSEELAAKKYDTKALEIKKEKAVLNILENPYRKALEAEKKKQMAQKRKRQNKPKRQTQATKIHKRVKFSIVTKNRICSKQHWNCNYCKNRLGDTFIVDHMIPLCLGGPNDEYNLQSLCPSCDRFKTSIIDYQILAPLAKMKKLTVDDVLKAQRDNYHRMMCTNPQSSTVNNTETMNINCQQYITNSNVNGTTLDGNKGLELNINGVQIKISI
jgi:hypothetical protein